MKPDYDVNGHVCGGKIVRKEREIEIMEITYVFIPEKNTEKWNFRCFILYFCRLFTISQMYYVYRSEVRLRATRLLYENVLESLNLLIFRRFSDMPKSCSAVNCIRREKNLSFYAVFFFARFFFRDLFPAFFHHSRD